MQSCRNLADNLTLISIGPSCTAYKLLMKKNKSIKKGLRNVKKYPYEWQAPLQKAQQIRLNL